MTDPSATVDALVVDARRRFVKGVLTVVTGNAAGVAVTLASLPVLAWIYSPADFAVLGVFSAIVAVTAAAGSLCYERVVPLARSSSEAANAFVVAVFCGALISAGAAVVLQVQALTTWRPAGAETVVGFEWLAASTLFAVSVQQSLSACLNRGGAFRDLATARLMLCSVQASAQLGAGWLGSGPAGLLYGVLLGNAASVAYSAWRLRTEARLLRRVSRRRMIAVARRRRAFPLYTAGPEVLLRLSVHLPTVVLAAYYTDAAGAYVLAQRLYVGPQTLIRQAVAGVFLSVGSSQVRSSRGGLRQLFVFTVRRVAAVATPAYLAAAVLAPFGVAWAFGDSWADAGAYIGVLAPMFYARLVVECVRPTIDLLNRPQLHTLGALTTLGALVSTLGCGVLLASPPVGMLGAMSLLVAASHALLLRWVWRRLPAEEAIASPAPTRVAA